MWASAVLVLCSVCTDCARGIRVLNCVGRVAVEHTVREERPQLGCGRNTIRVQWLTCWRHRLPVPAKLISCLILEGKLLVWKDSICVEPAYIHCLGLYRTRPFVFAYKLPVIGSKAYLRRVNGFGWTKSCYRGLKDVSDYWIRSLPCLHLSMGRKEGYLLNKQWVNCCWWLSATLCRFPLNKWCPVSPLLWMSKRQTAACKQWDRNI